MSTQDSALCTENIIRCSRRVPCVLPELYPRRSRCRIPDAASLHCPGLPHVSPTLPLLSAHCPSTARPRALSLLSLYASSLNWCVLSASPHCEVAPAAQYHLCFFLVPLLLPSISPVRTLAHTVVGTAAWTRYLQKIKLVGLQATLPL